MFIEVQRKSKFSHLSYHICDDSALTNCENL